MNYFLSNRLSKVERGEMVERTFIDGKVIRVHSEGLGRKLAFTTASLEYAPLHGADSARRLGLKGSLFFRLE